MGRNSGAPASRLRRNGALMNAQRVEDIAIAAIYEGHILYPYRASALKNRKRFNFGVV